MKASERVAYVLSRECPGGAMIYYPVDSVIEVVSELLKGAKFERIEMRTGAIHDDHDAINA